MSNTTKMQVTVAVHADLKLLKSIQGHRTLSDTIRFLIERSGYNQAFFERIREKVSE